jgi:hypothetical protein
VRKKSIAMRNRIMQEGTNCTVLYGVRKLTLQKLVRPFSRLQSHVQPLKKTSQLRSENVEIVKRGKFVRSRSAMSFASVRQRERAIAKETFSHHAFPAANKFCQPLEILAGREIELHLNVMKKLKSVTTEGIEGRRWLLL